jgi:hypothetical protein
MPVRALGIIVFSFGASFFRFMRGVNAGFVLKVNRLKLLW